MLLNDQSVCNLGANNQDAYTVNYFQVRFMNLSTVFAIQTQGGANMDRWVSTFRIEYSQDCANFSRVFDLVGNTQVRTFFIKFCFLHLKHADIYHTGVLLLLLFIPEFITLTSTLLLEFNFKMFKIIFIIQMHIAT